MSNYTNDQLTGTTDAVRNYMNNASEKEKTEKKGQQKWGLFETNYQRNKGISTDQSLQEIEEFCNTGVNVNVGGEDWSISGKPQSHRACSCGCVPGPNEKFCSGCGAQLLETAVIHERTPGTSSGFGAGASGFGAGGKPGQGNLNFPKGQGAGAQFFNQHTQAEAKKYQPERKW